MSFVDIILGLLLSYGLYKGFKNGIFVELASLVALIAGIFGAIHFSYIAGNYIGQRVNWDERTISITAFIITFIAIVILVKYVGRLLTKIADFAMLGLINKIAGALFGGLKIAVILGAVLIFFERINSSVELVKNETVQNSKLYAPIKEIGAFVFNAVLKGENLELQTEED